MNDPDTTASNANKTRPKVIAWIRAVTAAVCGIAAVWAFVQGPILISHGCMDRMAGDFLIWFVGIPALILGISSAIIAVGLFRKSISAAVILDTVIVIVIGAGLILTNVIFFLHGEHGDIGERLQIGLIGAAVALLFAGEAAWLSRVCRGRKTAWRDLGILAAVLALIVIVWPLVSRQLHVQHVQGLREFVATHLVAISPERPVTATRESASANGHTDCIAFTGGSAIWSATADHDSAGWHFMPGKARAVMHANSNWGTNINSSAAVIEYLRSAGVLAANIGTNCTSKQETSPPHRTFYTIESPALNGSFEISQYGAVELFLSSPLVVPARPR
jgi:hypothetical protein